MTGLAQCRAYAIATAVVPLAFIIAFCAVAGIPPVDKWNVFNKHECVPHAFTVGSVGSRSIWGLRRKWYNKSRFIPPSIAHHRSGRITGHV